MRDYAAMTSLIVTKLQSSGTADFSVAEVNAAISEGLKEFTGYYPHLVPITFTLESRSGTDVTGTSSKLTDIVKAQFVTTDGTDEKVVHNTTDNTWAVCTARDSATVLSLSSNIMAANENYKLYNKQCWNEKQIYIGDMTFYTSIDSVEYPIGTKRNWKVYDNILEVGVDYVPDSNSTLTTLSDMTVLVRFVVTHQLSNLTDWAGKFAATCAIAATTISGSSLQTAGTIDEGTEFTIQSQRPTYFVTASIAVATTAAITLWPPLEAAVAATTTTFTLRKSTLQANHEELFADLVAARLAMNKAAKYINTISIGGTNVWQGFQNWGERKLSETLARMQRGAVPHTRRTYTREWE